MYARAYSSMLVNVTVFMATQANLLSIHRGLRRRDPYACVCESSGAVPALSLLRPKSAGLSLCRITCAHEEALPYSRRQKVCFYIYVLQSVDIHTSYTCSLRTVSMKTVSRTLIQ
jgi:hypothetical protein